MWSNDWKLRSPYDLYHVIISTTRLLLYFLYLETLVNPFYATNLFLIWVSRAALIRLFQNINVYIIKIHKIVPNSLYQVRN